MLAAMTPFPQEVYKVTKCIPRGKVTTYAAIARALKNPRAARAVGNALHKNPFVPQVPCHRVVQRDGKVGGFARGRREKIKILRHEGVKISNGKVEPAFLIIKL